MKQHMHSLYIVATFDGVLVGRVLIDNGATVNVLPLTKFRLLGYKSSELVRTDVAVSGFNGRKSECLGICSVHLGVGRHEQETAFFVIDIAPSFNALLGRDWLHKAAAIPSTLHRELILWLDSEIETIRADEYSCCDKGILHAETCKTIKDLTLDQRYKLGDPTVGPLGEPSGEFDFIVSYGTSHPKPDEGPIVPTGWGPDFTDKDMDEVLQEVVPTKDGGKTDNSPNGDKGEAPKSQESAATELEPDRLLHEGLYGQ
ncbi:hypothetical protein MLD38_025845 [Melastoma candidum]|uniref:Uncharacterized protein n=1 Tax=Melastoma candidum TaxID=119954 RepID=A0ACB9P3J5_9MYRT|nr:hypothetical protein MLD38_025845 [Melastoma candidum]